MSNPLVQMGETKEQFKTNISRQTESSYLAEKARIDGKGSFQRKKDESNL